MQKNYTRTRLFSSNSKDKSPSLTSQKSLSKLKQRLKSTNKPQFTVSNNNQRIKDEYLVKNNKVQLKPQRKTSDFKQRRKQSLILLNRDIKFENQLKDEIKSLHQTLKECKKLQKQEIYKNFKIQTSQNENKSRKLSIIDEYLLLPQNILQLVHLQQRIQNRNEQIELTTDQISQLKQQFWYTNIRKQPQKQNLQIKTQNFNIDRFLLAQQTKELNYLLKSVMKSYQNKVKELQVMKIKINNAFKDSQHYYKIKLKNSSKQKAFLIQKPVSYTQFKQYLIKKKRQAKKPKQQLQRVKSTQYFIPSSLNLNQFSNISNVSAILPMNFIDSWFNRQLLPGQVPQLPKQKNPTMKGMNFKKKVLKQAIQTQKHKHQKEMTEKIDKLLFLHDEDLFLSEQIDSLKYEINQLDTKFSWMQMKSQVPTMINVSKNQQNLLKRKFKGDESSILSNVNKNYVQGNLLLDNTGMNSNFLDQTTKVFTQI